MVKTNKAIGPIVATALFLVIAIVSVVGFQTWFNNYSSITLTQIENQNTNEAFTIEEILENTLYIKNNENT